MKAKHAVPVVLILAVAGIAGFSYLRNREEHDAGRLRVSGNIEITDAQISFRIPGHVVKRLVDEGEIVTNGTVIAELETADLTLAVAARQAELQAAQALLAELEAGSRPQEIAAAEATVARFKAQEALAEVDYRRAEKLSKENTISAQELDAARATFEVSTAQLRETEEQLKLIREGPRKEDIDQARARVEQAKQAVALAQTQLGYAVVRAPFNGVVLSKNIEPGEYVMPGTPIVTIGNLDNVWLRAYVNETDLGRVKLGQKVRVTTDTYSDKAYEGRISFISSGAEFTPKNVQTPTERVKLVYRIKVDIGNPHMELKPGMPADGEIQLQ